MKNVLWTEGAALPILSLVLVCVFCVSVCMYDDFCTWGEDEALAVFASALCDLVGEKDALAVSTAVEKTDVSVMAEEYIARYNAIYRDLQ